MGTLSGGTFALKDGTQSLVAGANQLKDSAGRVAPASASGTAPVIRGTQQGRRRREAKLQDSMSRQKRTTACNRQWAAWAICFFARVGKLKTS